VSAEPIKPQSQDCALGTSHRGLDILRVAIELRGDRLCRADRTAANMGALDDAGIVLDVGGGWRRKADLTQVHQTAGGFIHPHLDETVGRSVVVNRHAIFEQSEHRPEDVVVANRVEVLGSQQISHSSNARWNFQDRPEHCLLGMQAVRRQLRITDVALDLGADAAGHSVFHQNEGRTWTIGSPPVRAVAGSGLRLLPRQITRKPQDDQLG
jgi:hypothetical protein